MRLQSPLSCTMCVGVGGSWVFKDLLSPGCWTWDLSLQKLPLAAWPPPPLFPQPFFLFIQGPEKPLNGAELDVTWSDWSSAKTLLRGAGITLGSRGREIAS